ncbi:unnamed protein product [Darwinula stevensoni]|uniref:Uncharacterized protein n=1 Tax=Darwinula stevensoni TaxID=69355 RepID=A0A7R9FRI7_9CRUS|nr:unnamed protein product [Darwinula stevensoni]CAG0901750.1 unnamed protein product [Darwinula stevensoni]
MCAEPTWNDTAMRIAEVAENREDWFDQKTGKINCLSQETWNALTGVLPLSKDSSPFTDWGYAWDVSRMIHKGRNGVHRASLEIVHAYKDLNF